MPTKHHSSPDGLNFAFQTLNLIRHLATVHREDSSHTYCLGCDQVSLNLFSGKYRQLPCFPVKAGFRQVRSFLLLFLASSPSSLSSLMYLVVKMWPIVSLSGSQGVLISLWLCFVIHNIFLTLSAPLSLHNLTLQVI